MAPPGVSDPVTGLSAGDMFLSVKGAKGGVIKGESQDDAHKSEIDVLSWSWGMHARPSLGGGGATGKAAVHELKVVKKIDSASTALLSPAPVSAVPVFPAARMPEIWAAVPVPPVTTACIIEFSSEATSGFITRAYL